MRFVKVLLIAATLLPLVGCASAGHDFDTAHTSDVQKGVQDKAQIRAWFGEPYQSQSVAGHPAGCSERWTYTYAYSDRGGMRTQSKTLVVDFDESGVVCDHAFAQQ